MTAPIGHATVECPECHSEHSEELHLDHTSYAAYSCECGARVTFSVTTISAAHSPASFEKYPRLKHD